MSEYSIGYLAVGNVVALAIACLFYMMGGRANKWLRRYIGSFILALSVNITSLLLGHWSPFLLILYPIFIGCFSLGYGGDDTGARIIKRIIVASASLAAGVLMAWLFGCWWMLIPQVLCSATTILFAIKNPIQAAAEEPLVCILNSGVLLFFTFVS